MLNQKRNDLLLEVLELGYKEITIPCDFSTESGTNKPDKGLFYLKSNECSIAFLKYMHFERVTYPTYSDKSLCETTTFNLKERKQINKIANGHICSDETDFNLISTDSFQHLAYENTGETISNLRHHTHLSIHKT